MRLNWQVPLGQIPQTGLSGQNSGSAPGLAAARGSREKASPMSENKTAKESPGLREGEVAAELPERFDASLYYIGRIRTPWKRREDCPKNPRETEAVCTIVLDPRWAEGLQGLEGVSHVVVLYWMDRARRDLVLQAPHHYSERRGAFAPRTASGRT